VMTACGGSGNYLTNYNADTATFERMARGAVKSGCTREVGSAVDFFRCKDNVIVHIVEVEGREFISCQNLDDAACRTLTDGFYSAGAQ
jgi:hypothetical protein